MRTTLGRPILPLIALAALLLLWCVLVPRMTLPRFESAQIAPVLGAPRSLTPVSAPARSALRRSLAPSRDAELPAAALDPLEARAKGGDPSAQLQWLDRLDACARHREAALVLDTMAQFHGDRETCATAEACAALERLYDDFAAELGRWHEDAQRCGTIGRSAIELRGAWLAAAARAGEPDAMACYALAGHELAPHPSREEWPGWMEAWRRDALTMAWNAWRAGEPRAALALARIYGQDSYYRLDAAELADADPRIEYRYASLIVRSFDLDPEHGLVRGADLAASALDTDELAAAERWLTLELPAFRARLDRASRVPDDCWQHFAMFTPASR
jgi:hypothetical protein